MGWGLRQLDGLREQLQRLLEPPAGHLRRERGLDSSCCMLYSNLGVLCAVGSLPIEGSHALGRRSDPGKIVLNMVVFSPGAFGSGDEKLSCINPINLNLN